MSLQLSSIHTHIATMQRKASAFLWQQDLDQVPIWKRGLIRSSQIIVAVIRDLMQEQLSLRAMSLVFTTVIGFFPMIALTFAVLKSLGVHNAMEPTLLTLLQPLGERANEFTQQILSYVDNLQVQLIGITSVGLLIYFVLDMMRKIESAFNYIWAVKKGRSLSSRISEYLFAVIVSPLLLFLSISLTSYINTNFFESFLENLIFGSVIIEASAFVISILLMSLAFAFAYSFLPNTKVQFSSAFIGGLVTTIIWKLMGSVFQGIFVASARESIYLAFASAIAIMFFIYIGWLVALIGSSIAFYHQNPSKTHAGRTTLTLSIAQQEQLSLAVAIAIIRRFQLGGAALTDEELARNLDSNQVAIEQALEQLQKIGLISRTGDQPPAYLPSHSVEDCTMVEIWQALRDSNTDHISISDDSTELLMAHQFQQDIDDAIMSSLGSRKFVDLGKEVRRSLMSEYILYHNPRCSKSRAALALLEENDINPTIVYYLEKPPTPDELRSLLDKLGLGIRDILRTGEKDYDELDLGDETLSDEIVFDLVCKHPKLIERPIFIHGDKAIIGRPPEKVLTLLEN